MTLILLESKLLLFACWIPAQFLFLALWSWRRSNATKRAMWIGFAALPLLLGLSIYVETDRERIVHVCQSLADAVERADVPAVAKRIAPEFESDEYTRDHFLDRLGQQLQQNPVFDPRIFSFEITIAESGTATAEFQASATVRSVQWGSRWILSRWRLRFRRGDETWLVTHIEPVPTPALDVRHLRDWLQ